MHVYAMNLPRLNKIDEKVFVKVSIKRKIYLRNTGTYLERI